MFSIIVILDMADFLLPEEEEEKEEKEEGPKGEGWDEMMRNNCKNGLLLLGRLNMAKKVWYNLLTQQEN